MEIKTNNHIITITSYILPAFLLYMSFIIISYKNIGNVVQSFEIYTSKDFITVSIMIFILIFSGVAAGRWGIIIKDRYYDS